jgi:hypothetical protein
MRAGNRRAVDDDAPLVVTEETADDVEQRGFPQPDGPMIDTNSPGATRNEMSSTARMSPSLLTNFW